MRENTYNLEDIQRNLNEEITEKQALVKAWKKVTFPTKKDGKPFANMSKNFDGARYQKNIYSEHYELSVYGKVNGVYYDTSINCYNFKEKRNMSFEEIKEAIAGEIKRLEDSITTLKADLACVKPLYESFSYQYKKSLDDLKTNTGYSSDKTLYRMICNTVIKNTSFDLY